MWKIWNNNSAMPCDYKKLKKPKMFWSKYFVSKTIDFCYFLRFKRHDFFFSNCFEPIPYTILDEKICMFTLKSCSAQFGLVIFCMKNLVKTTSNFKSPQEDENCREIIEQFAIFCTQFSSLYAFLLVKQKNNGL